MRTRIIRALSALPLALALLVGATACSSTASIAVDEDTTIIDVRTPGEYAAGHLEGAVNIDVSSSGFPEQIAALDPEADYVVYCQSGNRSSQAVAQLDNAGFTSVTDAGGMSAASTSTGLPVVTD